MKRGSAIHRYLDRFIGIPLLNLLALRRRKRVRPANPQRIGILFNPAIGDTLLASASIGELRELYPRSRLIALVASTNLPAAMLLPQVDEIELLAFSHPLKSIRAIRRCNIDLLVDLSAWQRITAVYSFFSGAQFTAGFKRVGQHRHRGYDLTVPHRGDCHELDNLRRITRVLGSTAAHSPTLTVPEAPLPCDLAHAGRIVILHPWASGSGSALREWPNERWLKLAQRLKTPGRVFVITGSPAEEARSDSLLQMLLSHSLCARVLIGRDGLENIARVIGSAELAVSVNTGIMHLSAILGTPTVGLNGPTAVHRWGAVGPRVANISPLDGSGGFLDLGFEYGRHHTSVMTQISVDQVVRAIDQLLCNRGERRLAAFEGPAQAVLVEARVNEKTHAFAAAMPRHKNAAL